MKEHVVGIDGAQYGGLDFVPGEEKEWKFSGQGDFDERGRGFWRDRYITQGRWILIDGDLFQVENQLYFFLRPAEPPGNIRNRETGPR